MKLFLSSYRIPAPNDLADLLNKPLSSVSVALIPNAKDYYAKRVWDIKVSELVSYMQELGLKVDIVDLRDYSDADTLRKKLSVYDLIWAMGGNTYMLRYEMRRSGFDQVIDGLLDAGTVYGGDSAGALVAGVSIAGVESADEPEFAEEPIKEGLGLMPFVILPHVDNPEFVAVLPEFRSIHQAKEIIELKDSQAVIFDDEKRWVVEGKDVPRGDADRSQRNLPELQMVEVVAGCVVKREGKYLLVQERKPKAYGQWNLPAGRVNMGEAIEDGAIRETLEETGFKVTLGVQIATVHAAADTPVLHAFLATITGGELKPNLDELLDVQWFSLDEIRELDAQEKVREGWALNMIEKGSSDNTATR